MLSRKLILIVMVFLCASCAREEKPPFAASIAAGVITPAYQSLAGKTAEFAKASNESCSDGAISNIELAQVRQQWLVAMSAWQQVQIIRFGPVEAHNTRWQFQFWPDKHNNTGKKVKALLAKTDALQVTDIDDAGVVVQGLSALEYLLFDKANHQESFSQPGFAASQRCLYLQYATQKLANTAAQLATQWARQGDYFKTFTTPGPQNSEFPDTRVNMAVVLDSVVSALEIIKVDKIASPLGLKTARQKINVYASEAWRSQESLVLIQNNLQFIESLLDAPQAGLLYQLPDDQETLAATVRQQLATAKSRLQGIKSGMNESLRSKQGQQALQGLHDSIEELLKTCKNVLPPVLGVSLSFNGNDGD